MRKIVAIVGLAGWAAITALGWFMANDRIALCKKYVIDRDCIVASTAARDNLLILCLTLGLVAVLVTLATLAVAKARRSSGPTPYWTPANRARAERLR